MQPNPADSPGEGGGRKIKKRPAWQIFLMAVAAMGLCLGAAYAIGYWRQASALNAEIAAIRARGEPVQFADLAPLPGDENLARGDRLSAALSKLKPLDDEFNAQFGSEELPDVADFSRFLPVLDKNREQLEKIIEVCREGDCRFRYDFDVATPFGIPLPNVQLLHAVRKLLVADVLRLLAAGDFDHAAAQIDDLLLTASVLRHDPFYVSQNLRLSNEERALDLIERLLTAGDVSPGQLATLDQHLEDAEASFRLGPAVQGERAQLMSTFECLGRPEMGEWLDCLMALTPDGQGQKVVSGAFWKNLWWGSWLYAPWRMKEQTYMLGDLCRAAEIIDEPGPAATFKLLQADMDFRAARNEYPICSVLRVDLTKLRDQALAHRQRLIAARLAIHAIRYRSQHGSLPETLDRLAEAAKVSTIGLRTGKPLSYDRNGAGIAIYDQGEDDASWGRFAVEPRQDDSPGGESTAN